MWVLKAAFGSGSTRPNRCCLSSWCIRCNIIWWKLYIYIKHGLQLDLDQQRLHDDLALNIYMKWTKRLSKHISMTKGDQSYSESNKQHQHMLWTFPRLCFSPWTTSAQQKRFDLNATPPQSWETSRTATCDKKDGCTSNKSSRRRARWAWLGNSSRQKSHGKPPETHVSSLLRRRWAAACVPGSGSFRCFAPIRCSSTRTRGKRCSAGPRSEVRPRTSSQSASGAAWWTSRTARPSGSTPCGWPRRTSVSTCFRPRTGRTCWSG